MASGHPVVMPLMIPLPGRAFDTFHKVSWTSITVIIQ